MAAVRTAVHHETAHATRVRNHQDERNSVLSSRPTLWQFTPSHNLNRISRQGLRMDFDNPKMRDVFFDLHEGLPRQGPGDRACTERALRLAGPLPASARVLDIGCGPGMQTIDLAGLLPDAEILALDTHEAFVAEARRRAAARGLGNRVKAITGDMASLPFPRASFDLIWCEGAAYIMGVGQALRSWRPLLKPGGKLALSEVVWLTPEPPDEVRHFWSQAYPDMRDLAACRSLVRDCGYHLLGDFPLPERAWWEHYYTPLEQRLRQLAPTYAGDPLAEAVLRECREEIITYRKYAATYGYVFLVMARDRAP
jgi:SAM-dependent methyltransferase